MFVYFSPNSVELARWWFIYLPSITTAQLTSSCRDEALLVLTCRSFPVVRLEDLAVETALPVDGSFK